MVVLTIRFCRSVGLWEFSEVGASPEQMWRDLGITPKLFVVVAFLLTSGLVYFPVLEASGWQATFGKRLLNIYVTGREGGRIGMRRALGRWIAKCAFNWFPLLLISIIPIIASRERKGLHDTAAGTAVLTGRPVPGGILEPWRIVVAIGVPFVWTLGTMLATL